MAKHALLLAAGLALAATTALASAAAADPEPPAPAPKEAKENDPDEVVCKKERPTGSRVPREVCRKRSDIEDSADAGRWLLDRRKHGSSGG